MKILVPKVTQKELPLYFPVHDDPGMQANCTGWSCPRTEDDLVVPCSQCVMSIATAREFSGKKVGTVCTEITEMVEKEVKMPLHSAGSGCSDYDCDGLSCAGCLLYEGNYKAVREAQGDEA